MKCREMNPGKEAAAEAGGLACQPSMKCREMNPGKRADKAAADLDYPPQ